MKLPGILIIFVVFALSACFNESNTSNDFNEDSYAVLSSIESPGENITGLAWGDGFLWAVDATSVRIYRINAATGDILDSFKCGTPSSYSTTGLAFSEEYDHVYLGLWDYDYSGYVYCYSPGGEYIGSVSMCGG